MDTCKFLLKIKYNTDKSSSGRKTDDADKNSLYPKNSGLVICVITPILLK